MKISVVIKYRTSSILVQVIACCLTIPNHYLNQCWLIVNIPSAIHIKAIAIVQLHKSHNASIPYPTMHDYVSMRRNSSHPAGWVGLWGFLWWAPSAKGKDHHWVSSGWSSIWHRSNTGLSSTQYEQIPIILGVWPFWLTPFFFRSITFWRAYG